MRKPNLMRCDVCGKVADFKDEYKPDTLFHSHDDKSLETGIWRRFKKLDV